MHCVYPVMSKCPKQPPNCLKRAEISFILIVFDGVLCDIHLYTVTISDGISACIRYQKNYILVSDYITKIYLVNAIQLLK